MILRERAPAGKNEKAVSVLLSVTMTLRLSPWSTLVGRETFERQCAWLSSSASDPPDSMSRSADAILVATGGHADHRILGAE